MPCQTSRPKHLDPPGWMWPGAQDSARNAAPTMRRVSIDHYENFPVASLLCPAAIRPAVVALYRFARTADDLADEGDASAGARLGDLLAYRNELVAALAGQAIAGRWPNIFMPLRVGVQKHALPSQPLNDLLDAFEQDVRNPPYPDRAALLDYCRRSANPVGRLMLHLHGVGDAQSVRESDAICTALQLINFWQDLSLDQPRGRNYVPHSDAARHGLSTLALGALPHDQTRTLVQDLCAWAEGLMHDGAPLALRLPGRAGWELRLVVQGGLRILEKIRAIDHATLQHRPRLTRLDAPLLLWRALAMRARAPSARAAA